MESDSENDFLEDDYYSVLNLPKSVSHEILRFSVIRFF